MDIIDKISPVTTYKHVFKPSDIDCTICLESFNPQDPIRKLRCGHISHSKCIEDWIVSNTCCCRCKQDCSIVDDPNESIGDEVSLLDRSDSKLCS